MTTIDAKCRQCRREGEKLFLKGDKCYNKCTLLKRNYIPGQHGLSRRGKPSDYSVMLREKQKVKRIYGMRESQFKTYFEKASRRRGVTGEVLLSMLESRIDSVVYRMGFADSRAQAKQLVSHGLFSVNDRKVNIPSIVLKPGDKVTISGPYGEFFAKETDNEMIFVGGGSGMAPMRSHIFDQLKRLHAKRKISFWYGARSLGEVFYNEDFNRLAQEYENFSWTIGLSDPQPEDNWQGATGFIHQILYENYLKDHPAPEDCEYYLCGPPMMIAAVEKVLDDLGVNAKNIMFDKFGG
jgi:ribosomal protein S4